MREAEIIYGLEKSCFDDCWSYESVENQLGKESSVFVIEESGLGYALGDIILDEAELYRIAVSENSRKSGLGTAIINEFIGKCRDRGAEKIFLEVRSRNIPARKLYEKTGFKEISVRRNYYDDDDAVIYCLKF